MDSSESRSLWALYALAAAAIIAVIFLIGSCAGAIKSYNKTGPTQVALIRNGGPFDSHSIRTIRGPSSGPAISGLWSSVRMYIAGNEQRYYTVSSDPNLGDRAGVDFFQVPTQDGVQVSLDGTVYFHTAFTGAGAPADQASVLTPQSKALLAQFDTQYGNRNFALPGGEARPVWDGNDGWNAWLNSIFRPVLDNAVRETLSQFDCSDLVSSCALVQQNGQKINLSAAQGRNNAANFNKVQDAINSRLQSNVDSALGGPYLRDIHFRLQDVKLPDDVQTAINTAQSSFAQIAEARAQNKQSEFQARANNRLAQAYRHSPALALLNAAKELKDNSNATIILGNPGGMVLGK